MTAFISAGHNPKGPKVDPGAVANGLKEADLAIEFRDLVIKELLKLGVKVISDKDDETLSQYLLRIKPGNGSVILEFHFDAAASATATGTTSLYSKTADKNSIAFAKDLVDTTALILGIKNRGAISEALSHRGSLGIMRKQGIVALLELCFITNLNDLEAYKANKEILAVRIAAIVKRYEDLIV